ncbi:carboxypeptidase regulatory-like domain-containing protein [Candidatus Micrarchaeota archaeon]|nr:carboxypeptidase regulatory-like domain-containing protein [Candidatus Micrarchaeota archaeon]
MDYSEFLSSLEEKGVPSPNILVPVFIALALAAAAFFAYPAFASQGGKAVVLTVTDSSGLAVPQAQVILSGRGFSQTAFTDSNGEALFEKAPQTDLSATVSKEGFENQSIGLSPTDLTSLVSLSAQSPLPKASALKVLVVDKNSNAALSQSLVTLSFSAGTKTATTDANGEAVFSLDSLPSDASVAASKNGFAANSVLSLSTSEIAGSSFSPITIYLSADEKPEAKYSFTVSVQDSDANGVDNIVVTAKDSFGKPIGLQKTSGGQASFSIVAGKQFSIEATDPSGAYKKFSSEPLSLSKDDGMLVALEKKVSGAPTAISVSVTDSAGKALPLSDVFLYDIKSNKQLDSKATDSSGLAKFQDVDESQSYYVSASKEDFLPAIKTRVKPGESYSISLDAQKAGNYVGASYLVFSNSLPAASAQVALFIAGGAFDGFFLGIPAFETGEDGYAYFTVPKSVPGGGKLLAKAALNELVGESAAQDPRASYNQSIELFAPLSELRINATDAASGRALDAAAQAFVDGKQISSCRSASAGSLCVLKIPGNSQFTYSVGAPNYVLFESSASTLYPTESRVEKIQLHSIDSIKAAKVVFDGLFDSLGRKVEFPTNAAEYAAKFTLTAPKSDFSGITIRAGGELSAENDFAFISYAPLLDGAILSGGKTFSTTACQSTGSDLNAYKFVQYDFNKSSGFSRQLSVKIQVLDGVPAGKPLLLYYSAFSSNSDDPSIYPFEEKAAAELIKAGGARALSKTDFCTAPQQKAELTFSSFSYSCSNGVCGLFVFSKDSKKATKNLDIPLGGQARVDYSIASATPINSIDVFTKHFVEGDDVLESGSTATQAGGSKISLAASFSSSDSPSSPSSTPAFSVPVDWVKGKTSAGSFSLRAVKPSNLAAVSFGLNGESEESSAKFTTTMRVSGRRAFRKPVVSPSQFTLGLEESLSIDLLDSLGERIADAQVAAFECEGRPLNGVEAFLSGDGTTNAGKSGHYEILLKPSKVGKIGVRAQGADFAVYETPLSDCISVSQSDYISAQPTEISLTGDSSTGLSNATLAYSLLPVSTRVTTSFSCDGAQNNLVKVNPSSFELQALDEVELALSVAKGANLRDKYCVLSLNAQAGASSVQNLLLSVFVNVTDYSQPATKDIAPGATLVFPLSKTGDIAFGSGQYSTKALGELQSCSLMEFSQGASSSGGTSVSCLDNGRIMQVTSSYDLSDSSVCFPQTGLIQLTAPNGVSQFISLRVIGPSGARQCAVTVTPSTPPSQCVQEGGISGGGDCCSGLTDSNGVCVRAESCSADSDCPSGQLCSLGSCVVQGINYDALPSAIEFALSSTMEATKYFDASKIFSTIPASAPDECEVSQATLDSESKGRIFAKCEPDATGRITVLRVDASYSSMKFPYLNYGARATILLKKQGLASKEVFVKVKFDPSTQFPQNKADCSNGVLDGDEAGIDCGGSCPNLCSKAACNNRIKDENEEGIDCGGVCSNSCVKTSLQKIGATVSLTLDSLLQDKKLLSLEPIEAAGCKITSCSLRPSISDSRLNKNRPITSYVTLDEARCLDGVLDLQAEYNSFPGLYRSYQGSGAILFECENKPSVQRPVSVGLDSSLADLPDKQLTCSDGVKNADEHSVDCGGSCELFEQKSCPAPSCSDGVSNGDEAGVDCGGSCSTLCTADLYEPVEEMVYAVLDSDGTFLKQFNLASLGAVTSCSVKMIPLLDPSAPRGSVFASCSNNVLTVDAQFPREGLYNSFAQGGRISFNLKNGGRATKQLVVDANNVFGIPFTKPVTGVATLPSRISLTASSSPYQFNYGQGYSSESVYPVKFKDAPSCDVKGFALNYLNSGQFYPQNSFAQTPFNQQNWLTGYGFQQYSYNPVGVPMGCQPPQVFSNPLGCPICQDYLGYDGEAKNSVQSAPAYSNGLYSQNPLFAPNSGIPVECSPPLICTKQGFEACKLKYCQPSQLTNQLNQYVSVTATCDQNQLSLSASYNGPSQSTYGVAQGQLVVTSEGATRRIPVSITVIPASSYGGPVYSDSKTMYCSGKYAQFSREGSDKGIPKEIKVYVSPDTGFGETKASGLEIAGPILCNTDAVKSAALKLGLQADDVACSEKEIHVKASSASAGGYSGGEATGEISWSYGFANDFTAKTKITFVKDDFTPLEFPLFVSAGDGRVDNYELSSEDSKSKFAGIDSEASSVGGLKDGEINFHKGIVSFGELEFDVKKVKASSAGSVFVKTVSPSAYETTREVTLLPIIVPGNNVNLNVASRGASYSIDSDKNPALLPKFYSDGKKVEGVTCTPLKPSFEAVPTVSCESADDGLKISFDFNSLFAGAIDERVPFRLEYLGQSYEFSVKLTSPAKTGAASATTAKAEAKPESSVELSVYRISVDKKTNKETPSDALNQKSDGKYHVNQGQKVRIGASYAKVSTVTPELSCNNIPGVKLNTVSVDSFGDQATSYYFFTQPDESALCKFGITVGEGTQKVIQISSETKEKTGETPAPGKKSKGAGTTSGGSKITVPSNGG